MEYFQNFAEYFFSARSARQYLLRRFKIISTRLERIENSIKLKYLHIDVFKRFFAVPTSVRRYNNSLKKRGRANKVGNHI